MEEQPITIRIFPGELRPVYYTSVLAFHSTRTLEVIRLALERLQIYEDKTLYELFEGEVNVDKNQWKKLSDEDFPVSLQEKWKHNQSKDREMRFFLRRKEHASLVLTEIVSQYISPEVNEGRVQDMCNLEELTEQDMLSNLRARFSNKDIYTYVGSILISINPYYFYSIYNPKYTSMYQGKALGSLPPHIFAIADISYHTMLHDRENQSVIISGESGAGKTESTKFLLHHLMSLSAKMDESQSLELITLGTGPVLEAFGNARTVANNNSSRFGKFILVQFKENGAYHRASIEKYLLEKSRIVSQAPEERNYHVFYYLLAGADPNLRKKLKLLDIDEYNYLTQGSSLVPENGAEEYHRLRQSLSMLRFNNDVQMGMLTVLSAILQLGNVTIEKKEKEEELEIAQIQNVEAVEIIASLLQVDEVTLRTALTTRKSQAGGTDSFVTPYRVEQAVAARDSMAKALYGALFDWIVDKVNVTLSAEGNKLPHKGNSIGVLDIFGFEVFKKNSFEQFCINYANEQLQQYFNKHIFKVEQAEYIAEGIEWSSVNFVDNQECLDLIAKKPTGLLPLLDEECSFPGADDNSLYLKFERQHKTNSYYHSPQLKLKDPQFAITHFASDVTYSIKGFREKNRDLMRQDIVDVLKTSHMDLVRALIGQPPFAVHCWRMAYLKIIATFAFRKAGQDYKSKQSNFSLSYMLRVGSTPQMSRLDQGRNSVDGINQVDFEDKDCSSDRIMKQNQLQAGAQLRPSRSFDMLITAGKKRDDSVLSSSMGSSCCLPFGASPMASRRKQSDKPPPLVKAKSATLPSSPSKHKKSPEKEKKFRRRSSLSKKKEEVQKKTSLDEEKPQRRTSLSKKKEGEQQRRPSLSKTPEKKEEGRSRKSSLSRMQERLRKRLSRSTKIKESPELRERPSARYHKSAQRLKLNEYPLTGASLYSLARSSSMRHGPPKTVSAQFQGSLISLMERLEKTNPFFVRCIKSNGEKAPCKFDNDLVLRQLRYTGMMETIKIRKAGYSVRTDFEAFYEKYQFLMGPRSADLPGQIENYLQGFGSEDVQIGKTKVFMREKQKQALQSELGDKVLARIVKIQRWVRAKMLRCRFLHLRRNAITIQCAIRCWIAKKKTDAIRRRICSAVLVQSAWRRYVARKRLILLKQAAIILQAHWRGRSNRLAYKIMVEEHRQKLVEERRRREDMERIAEEKRRLEEAEQVRAEEEKKKVEEERRRCEKEETERRRQELEDEREARELMEEMNRIADEQLKLLEKDAEKDSENQSKTSLKTSEGTRSASALSSSSQTLLDQDVRDTLFQFDTIVSALEDTMTELTPSPRPLTPPTPPPTEPAQVTNPIHSSREGEESGQGKQQSDIINGVVGNGPLPKSNDLPSDNKSELSILRNVSKVKTLKEQFISPPLSSQISSTTSSSSKIQTRQEEIQKSRGNVKSLIAQLSLSDESERLLSPPPSPIDVDLAKFRNTNLIMEKITNLNKTVDSTTDSRHPRSYKPPTVRRKVVSPFLEQGKEEVSEEMKDTFFENGYDTNMEMKSRGEVTPTFRTVEENQLDDDKSGMRISRATEPSPQLEKDSPSKGLFKMDQKKLGLLLMSEDIPEGIGEHVVTEEHAVTNERHHTSSPQHEPEQVENAQLNRTIHRSQNDYSVEPTKAANSKCMEHSMKPDKVGESSHLIDSKNASSSRNESKRSHKDLESGGVSNRTPQHLVLDMSSKDKYNDDDDHLVSIVLPYIPPSHQKPISPSQSPYIPPSHQKPISPSQSPYIPPSHQKPISPSQREKDDWFWRKTNDPSPADDVLLTFPPPVEPNYDQPIRLRDSDGSDHSSPSPAHVEIMLGRKENGGVFTIPKLLESEHPLMQSRGYDHLSKKSEYDHLSPIETSKEDYVPMTYYRRRTASDVAAHRIRPPAKDNHHEEEFVSSEVVPREYLSSEHHFNSVQRRKRSAMSLTDPINILKHGGVSSLEESSELTRCLTPEEILSLNQHRPSTSPSERVRLFSFTKRHLKLPFTKNRGKREKDLRDKVMSPEKEGIQLTAPKHRRQSPVTGKALYLEKTENSKRIPKYPPALAHSFKQTTASKFGVYTCAACNKGFTGYMKQALKCVDCNIMVHRHCEERSPACKAHIESGSYVTMSRRKIISKVEDLDQLGRFLLEKIAVLARDSSHSSVVDKVFKHSLKEFHTFLISTYSLSIQSSVESSLESSEKTKENKEEPKINLTFSQLVSNFDNIFRGIAKREGLNDPCHISIGVNQIKTFLDEFGKARRTKRYSTTINPSALRRKPNSGKNIQAKIHKGHKFLPQQFKVTTVCEHCSKAIPLLESGEVCEVCGYTCHEICFKKLNKKCEGKGRSKGIPEYQPNRKVASTQFGVPIQDLVPANSNKVPPILEKCFHHLEANGLYTQGIYRKSAGVSSKKAVRTALEEDPENADLEPYHVHAVAAAVGGFFRELPEPLLTRDMYMEFLRAMDLTNKKERQETLHKLISRLPDINHAVFERLIFHLARIAQHEHINKMGPGNLAIIFAPCLLQGKEGRNPEDVLKDLQKQTECLEAIITEQVGKLTATIRGIRTLTSFARETETKLSELDSSQSSDSASTTPLSTLKGSKPATPKHKSHRMSMSDEERNRLTYTLEEIERERAELTVNLPKLEPFTGTGEEEEQGSCDSDRWTPSPSPSPLTLSSASTCIRSYRAFSPITESSELPITTRRNHGGDFGESSTLPTPVYMMITPPNTPPITRNSSDHSPLPALSVAPKLVPLTKNRVSSRPPIRPPSRTRQKHFATKSVETSASPVGSNEAITASGYEEDSTSNGDIESEDEGKYLMETTV